MRAAGMDPIPEHSESVPVQDSHLCLSTPRHDSTCDCTWGLESTGVTPVPCTHSSASDVARQMNVTGNSNQHPISPTQLAASPSQSTAAAQAVARLAWRQHQHATTRHGKCKVAWPSTTATCSSSGNGGSSSDTSKRVPAAPLFSVDQLSDTSGAAVTGRSPMHTPNSQPAAVCQAMGADHLHTADSRPAAGGHCQVPGWHMRVLQQTGGSNPSAPHSPLPAGSISVASDSSDKLQNEYSSQHVARKHSGPQPAEAAWVLHSGSGSSSDSGGTGQSAAAGCTSRKVSPTTSLTHRVTAIQRQVEALSEDDLTNPSSATRLPKLLQQAGEAEALQFEQSQGSHICKQSQTSGQCGQSQASGTCEEPQSCGQQEGKAEALQYQNPLSSSRPTQGPWATVPLSDVCDVMDAAAIGGVYRPLPFLTRPQQRTGRSLLDGLYQPGDLRLSGGSDNGSTDLLPVMLPSGHNWVSAMLGPPSDRLGKSPGRPVQPSFEESNDHSNHTWRAPAGTETVQQVVGSSQRHASRNTPVGCYEQQDARSSSCYHGATPISMPSCASVLHAHEALSDAHCGQSHDPSPTPPPTPMSPPSPACVSDISVANSSETKLESAAPSSAPFCNPKTAGNPVLTLASSNNAGVGLQTQAADCDSAYCRVSPHITPTPSTPHPTPMPSNRGSPRNSVDAAPTLAPTPTISRPHTPTVSPTPSHPLEPLLARSMQDSTAGIVPSRIPACQGTVLTPKPWHAVVPMPEAQQARLPAALPEPHIPVSHPHVQDSAGSLPGHMRAGARAASPYRAGATSRFQSAELSLQGHTAAEAGSFLEALQQHLVSLELRESNSCSHSSQGAAGRSLTETDELGACFGLGSGGGHGSSPSWAGFGSSPGQDGLGAGGVAAQDGCETGTGAGLNRNASSGEYARSLLTHLSSSHSTQGSCSAPYAPLLQGYPAKSDHGVLEGYVQQGATTATATPPDSNPGTPKGFLEHLQSGMAAAPATQQAAAVEGGTKLSTAAENRGQVCHPPATEACSLTTACPGMGPGDSNATLAATGLACPLTQQQSSQSGCSLRQRSVISDEGHLLVPAGLCGRSEPGGLLSPEAHVGHEAVRGFSEPGMLRQRARNSAQYNLQNGEQYSEQYGGQHSKQYGGQYSELDSEVQSCMHNDLRDSAVGEVWQYSCVGGNGTQCHISHVLDGNVDYGRAVTATMPQRIPAACTTAVGLQTGHAAGKVAAGAGAAYAACVADPQALAKCYRTKTKPHQGYSTSQPTRSSTRRVRQLPDWQIRRSLLHHHTQSSITPILIGVVLVLGFGMLLLNLCLLSLAADIMRRRG